MRDTHSRGFVGMTDGLLGKFGPLLNIWSEAATKYSNPELRFEEAKENLILKAIRLAAANARYGIAAALCNLIGLVDDEGYRQKATILGQSVNLDMNFSVNEED